MAGADPRFALSIVVPVHDEADNVAPLVAEIAGLAVDVTEIIFVDDGSTDDTAARLARLRRGEPRLRLLRHGRRAGQSAAISARSGATLSASSWTGTTIDRARRGSPPGMGSPGPAQPRQKVGLKRTSTVSTSSRPSSIASASSHLAEAGSAA